MVRMSMKEDIFDGLPTKEAKFDAIPFNKEDTLEGKAREQSGSEATVMKIDNFRNECVSETEDNLNRRLLQNHEEANKGYFRKNKIPVCASLLKFCKMACNYGAIWYYCTLCHCVELSTHQ